MGSNYISYIPAIVGILSIGLFVAVSGRSTRNRIFAIFSVIVSLWLACLFLADIAQNTHASLWFLRFALLFASFAILLFDCFTLFFPFTSKVIPKLQLLYCSLPLVIVAFLSLTPIVVSGVTVKSFVAEPQATGFLYLLSDIVSGLYLMLGVALLILKLRRSDAQQKKQIKFVLIGIVITVVINVVTGDILTLLKIDTGYINFSGISILIFSLSVAYAMTRHGLFDIRFFVVRAVAYLATLFVTTFLFVTPVVLLFSHFLDFHPGRGELALIVLLSVVALYVSQYLRKAFDRLTTRIFFRRYYDPQEILDELSDTLVRTADIAVLRNDTIDVLQKAVKPGFLKYILFADHSAQQDVKLARAIEMDSSNSVVVADNLGESRLGKLLKKEGIALAVKLRTTHKSLGYMVLGYKQSGETYTDRDQRMLGVAADEIAISLQNALRFVEIQNFNLTLQGKIDRATKELRRTNEKLKVLDETKDDFISMASHQLRTPLTSVKGYLSMVLEGDAGKLTPTERKMLTQAFNSSQHMVYLISDLLNVSRLKTGKFVIERTPINLTDVIADEIAQLKETAVTRSVELIYEKPKHYPLLLFDETKTRQVIMNFIDNAIYYTPAGGHITVALLDKPTTVELRVTDDGIGVPKAEQHHLFTKFYRAGNARKARPDGTGLGLYMAKKVVVAQGGAIIFKSTEGKGSTFGFTFSKSKVTPPPSPTMSID